MLMRAYVVLVFAFIFAPIVVSFVFSFSENRFPTLPLSEFSTIWYHKVLDEPAFADAVRAQPDGCFHHFGACHVHRLRRGPMWITATGFSGRSSMSPWASFRR